MNYISFFFQNKCVKKIINFEKIEWLEKEARNNQNAVVSMFR